MPMFAEAQPDRCSTFTFTCGRQAPPDARTTVQASRRLQQELDLHRRMRVVTASADSTDSYGVTDFASGFFRHDEEFASACRWIVQRSSRARAENGGGAWEYLFSEGLIDELAKGSNWRCRPTAVAHVDDEWTLKLTPQI